MYDLIVKRGTVVDPSQNLHGVTDVAIEDGKIAKIAVDIPAEESRRVVEVKGKVVTPGIIDLHLYLLRRRAGGRGISLGLVGCLVFRTLVSSFFCFRFSIGVIRVFRHASFHPFVKKHSKYNAQL